MVEVGSDIKGLKELAKNSGKLKKSFAGTTLRTALRNGAKPVLRVAKAKVPVDEGDLKRALAINAKVDRKGEGYADVGFRPAGILWRLRRAWYIDTAGAALPAASPRGIRGRDHGGLHRRDERDHRESVGKVELVGWIRNLLRPSGKCEWVAKGCNGLQLSVPVKGHPLCKPTRCRANIFIGTRWVTISEKKIRCPMSLKPPTAWNPGGATVAEADIYNVLSLGVPALGSRIYPLKLPQNVAYPAVVLATNQYTVRYSAFGRDVQR